MYESDGQGDFLEKLEEHSIAQDKEIERMCNFHYQGFIASVHELIRVRTDARELKVRYSEISLKAETIKTKKGSTLWNCPL